MDPSDLSMVVRALAEEQAMAELLASRQQGPEALDLAHGAVARAERLKPPESERDRASTFVADAYLTLGAVQAALQDWTAASSAAQRAVGIYQKLAEAGSKQFRPLNVARAEVLLRECRSHLQ